MAAQASLFATTYAVPLAVVGGAILFVAAIGIAFWALNKIPGAKKKTKDEVVYDYNSQYHLIGGHKRRADE